MQFVLELRMRFPYTPPPSLELLCPDETDFICRFSWMGQVLDKRHEHELLPSSAPCHVTRAASSSETALAVAQAVHAAQATTGEESNGVHEGYDDDDLG